LVDLVGIEPTTSPAGRDALLYLSAGILVDLVGIEPTTSSMPWKRAPKLRHRPTQAGNSSILFAATPFVNPRLLQGL
jgi:hypothetical protein